MKKILLILMAGFLVAACNNSGESATNKDTVSLEQNSDVNNQNTTVYDSGASKHGDTSSYEKMPNNINDSTPQ